MLESKLYSAFKEGAKDVKGLKLERRNAGPRTKRGAPDLTGCYKGQRFEIECKIDPNLPTVEQRGELFEWHYANAFAAVATYVEGDRCVWLFSILHLNTILDKAYINWNYKELHAAIKLPFQGTRGFARLDLTLLLKAIEQHRISKGQSSE